MLTRVRRAVSRYINIVAAVFVRAGLTPNQITCLSLVVGVIAFICSFISKTVFPFLILLAGFFDVIDGAIARATQRTSYFGAFLDSTTDRVVDALVILSLYHIIDGVSIYHIFAALTLSFLISYCRSRIESLGFKVEGVGIMERADRLIALFAISVAAIYSSTVAIIAFDIFILALLITVIQRIMYAYRVLK